MLLTTTPHDSPSLAYSRFLLGVALYLGALGPFLGLYLFELFLVVIEEALDLHLGLLLSFSLLLCFGILFNELLSPSALLLTRFRAAEGRSGAAGSDPNKLTIVDSSLLSKPSMNSVVCIL